MNTYLSYILDSLIYNIVDALIFGLSLAIFIKVISLLTPIKTWEKIKENSVALAIVLAILLILFGAYTISGYFAPQA